MLVFTGKYTVEDAYDYEGWIHAMKEFKTISYGMDTVAKKYLKKYMILSNEGCNMCEICTYPHAPCRFPWKLQHAIEGYGITVSAVAEKAGVNYMNGENTVTYFGALLYNEEDLNG
jgi:predicted metal-binding protein